MSVPDKEEDIKSMKLYSNVDRVYNELKELGIKPGDAIKVEVLSKFDQYHYYGTQTIDECISTLGIGQNSAVLDVGSGLGGPGRYLAHKCKCHVIAIELQEDLNKTAIDLSQRCGLSDNIRHIHGDFLKEGHGIEKESVDFVVSWLVFLHVTEKDEMFEKCRHAMKPGGKIYIEDYFMLNKPATPREEELLNGELYTQRLDTKEEYIKHLENAGFQDVKFVDLTEKWRKFVKDRVDNHLKNKERYVRIHNEQIFEEQARFFSAVSEVFQGGNVGGCLIIATASDKK